MAKALETSASVDDHGEDDEDSSCSSSALWCCFPGIALRRRARDGAARRHLLQDAARLEEESWLVRCAKKAKEASEVVAGPKWKNFIRSFSRKKRPQFHYDPDSYALNFSHVADEFSGRYADPLGISKS